MASSLLFNNLGLLHINMAEYNKAEQYLTKSLRKYESSQAKLGTRIYGYCRLVYL